MKISSEIQTKSEPALKRQVTSEKHAFNVALQSQTMQLKKQELEHLMKNITVQGSKLAQSRNFKDLAKFKRMIKEFLRETVSNGYSLERKHSFGLQGNRKLSIVKEVDQKLLELTDELMNQEYKTVNILGLIGEIKGLLVNLYT